MTGIINLDKYNGYHNITYDMVQKQLAKAMKSGIITSAEKDFIEKHFYKIRSTKGSLEDTRMKKIATHLVAWRKHYGINEEYTKITIDDIDKAIFYISRTNSQTGRPFKQTTLDDYVTILKGFMTFLIESGNSEISKTDIQKIKISLEDSMTKTAEDIPTEAEVMKIIGCAKTRRDEAAYSLMYDGGFRSCEIGRLKWNQIKFDNLGALVNVSDKTQKARTVRIMASVDALKKWKEEYPVELKSDGFVFLTQNNRPMTYKSLSAQFQALLERSGLKKHYTMHDLRHARITNLIQRGIHESTIKLAMWGNINTKQFETYLHLCSVDQDKEFCKGYGIEYPDDNKENIPALKVCSICGHRNSPLSHSCHNCNEPLDIFLESDLFSLIGFLETTDEYKSLISSVKNQSSRGIMI